MSHELRTPLNAIGGYVDLLDLGIHGPLTDDQRADLTRIKWNQRVLLRHIEDVLGLAKLEAGRLQLHLARIPIDEVLRNLEAFIAPALRSKGLQYHFEPCGPDALAYADPHKVEQIMVNLLSNAAKFTDSGRVDVRCLTHDDVVEIEVRDTGRGIAPTMRECIFEPFVQVDQELTHTAEGTGLGLAISRQLAREMGGDVTVDSELGTGSRFRLRLPRAGTDR
jgi:signal transduction histidine kinase